MFAPQKVTSIFHCLYFISNGISTEKPFRIHGCAAAKQKLICFSSYATRLIYWCYCTVYTYFLFTEARVDLDWDVGCSVSCGKTIFFSVAKKNFICYSNFNSELRNEPPKPFKLSSDSDISYPHPTNHTLSLDILNS